MQRFARSHLNWPRATIKNNCLPSLSFGRGGFLRRLILIFAKPIKKTNMINNDRYNALVRAFARVKNALMSEPSVDNFNWPVQVAMYSQVDALGETENFSVESFLDDVRAFNLDSTSTFVPLRRSERQCEPEMPEMPEMPRILIELVRAFKNRAPLLGEKFEQIVKTKRNVAFTAIEFLIAEFLYCDRSITHVEREIKNESFRIAMFNAHADALYIAALNIIRSYASAIARSALTTDVETAKGEPSNAN